MTLDELITELQKAQENIHCSSGLVGQTAGEADVLVTGRYGAMTNVLSVRVGSMCVFLDTDLMTG